jgi:hypothetical protein
VVEKVHGLITHLILQAQVTVNGQDFKVVVVVSERCERCERHDKYVKEGYRVKLKNVNLSLGETYNK